MYFITSGQLPQRIRIINQVNMANKRGSARRNKKSNNWKVIAKIKLVLEQFSQNDF